VVQSFSSPTPVFDQSWTSPGQDSAALFDTLKEKFLEEPVLIMPDPVKPFMFETDVSNWAVGAVLKQRGSDGEMHPCGFISHRLSDMEQRYQVYDRKLLAIKKAFKTWRHLLKGVTIVPHSDVSQMSHPYMPIFSFFSFYDVLEHSMIFLH